MTANIQAHQPKTAVMKTSMTKILAPQFQDMQLQTSFVPFKTISTSFFKNNANIQIKLYKPINQVDFFMT